MHLGIINQPHVKYELGLTTLLTEYKTNSEV